MDTCTITPPDSFARQVSGQEDRVDLIEIFQRQTRGNAYISGHHYPTPFSEQIEQWALLSFVPVIVHIHAFQVQCSMCRTEILLFRALAVQAIDCHYIISDDDVTVCPEDRPLALAYMNLHNTILSLDIRGLIASVVGPGDGCCLEVCRHREEFFAIYF